MSIDDAKALVGDLARPFAIYATSGAASVATITIAVKIDHPDLSAAGIFIGAVFTGVGLLYGAKAYENAQQAKHDASVQIAQAQAPQAGQ